MTTIALPADTVRFYNDGPESPTTPLLFEAERAYRAAFLAAAREAVGWEYPQIDVIDAAWEARRQARKDADLDPDNVHGVYRPGHSVEAARTRGRVQAFEQALQFWDELLKQGLADEADGERILGPWLKRVETWAGSEHEVNNICPPPWPDECMSFAERQKLLAPSPPACTAGPKSVRRLLLDYPALRPAVIHGLLRRGETMNVISAPKIGKSWLVTDLALAIATGRPWLDTFETVAGDVLIVDNELHAETTANRIPKVAAVRGIDLDTVADHLFVENLRGHLKDIIALGPYFDGLGRGRFRVIVLDAFYRCLPRDVDENDNGWLANIYNYLDSYADRLGCSFVLIHHSSKGNQSGKVVTDVGAGAGSQSRATDTHLVLRPHEERECVVLDAAVRSWPAPTPFCLRWAFPVWTPDPSLDPAALRPERPRRRPKAESAVATELVWDADRFVAAFVSATPMPTAAIIQAALEAGLSERRAGKLLKQAEAGSLVHRWRFGASRPVQFATTPQPEIPG